MSYAIKVSPDLYAKISTEPSFYLFRYRNLPCFIQRNMLFGQLCGYVGVPATHSLYGKDYSDKVVVDDPDQINFNVNYIGLLTMNRMEANVNIFSLDEYINVHGGITWAEKLAPGIEGGCAG